MPDSRVTWRIEGEVARYVGALAAAQDVPDVTATTPGCLHVMLAGNCNTDFLRDPLRVEIWQRSGIPPLVESAPYGSGVQAALADAPVGDVWVFWVSALGASRGGTARPPVDVAGLSVATSRLISLGRRVIVVLPEVLPAEADSMSPFGAWRHEQHLALRERLDPAVMIVDPVAIQVSLGMEHWYAPRYWVEAKCPCHPDAVAALGGHVGAMIANGLAPSIRAIVVDLDDTVWGGRVGELEPAELRLDPDGHGRPFIEMQRWLLDQGARGIPLGVVSKNDDARARRPFVECPEMLLTLDDVVFFSASWEGKHLAIRAFADRVNVAPAAVCFIDDSPLERDEARALVPGLVVPDLPDRAEARVPFLAASGLFLRPPASDEDAARAASVARRVASGPAGMDADEYLESLGMTLSAVPVGGANMARVASLLQKTNQFNLNGDRPGPTEIAAIADDASGYAYAFRLADSVGDHGTIAVLLARSGAEGVLRIGTWVMSCRVFNRGVEWATMAHVLGWACDNGLSKVVFDHRPTARNGLVAGALAKLGATAQGGPENGMEMPVKGMDMPSFHMDLITG